MQPVQNLNNFIDGLSDEVLKAFHDRSRLKKYRRGETVYIAGDQPTEMYQVVSGSIKLGNLTPDGREFLAIEFRDGDCFGEMGLIDNLPRASNATAAKAVELRVLPKADFNFLLDSYREFRQRCMLMLCRRYRYLYNLHTEANAMNLPERLGLTIYRLAHVQGVVDTDGSCYVSISQEELGRMLGASRQTVNKELNALVSQGAIELRYGKIYLPDLNAFEARFASHSGPEVVLPTNLSFN